MQPSSAHGTIIRIRRKPDQAKSLCLVVYLLVTAMVLPGIGLCVEPGGKHVIELIVFCAPGASFPGAVAHNPSGSSFNPCLNFEKEAQSPCVDIPFTTIVSDRRSVSPCLDSATLPTSFLALSVANQICVKYPFHLGYFSSEHPHESLRSTVLLI